MRITGYRPANAWLERQLDQRWTRWLTWCASGGVVAVLALWCYIAPHQAVIRLRYETAKLSAEVERLEREHRTLLLERERLTSVQVLVDQAAALGLVPLPLERVAVLTQEGLLIPAPGATAPQAATEGAK